MQQASRCVDCFTVFDVNSDYNIFVAGVDTLGKANPSIQFHSWVQFERAQDYATNLQGFVNDVYTTYCVTGVTAILNDVKQSLQFPDGWPSNGYVYIQDRIKFLVWAIVDRCPGWE